MGDWVELRVHGVSGTPPKDMLGPGPEVGRTVSVERSWERGRSAAYRWQDEDGNWVPGPGGQVLEAFHWGGYTSGSVQHAFWLALLPFGLANVALFMLPPGDGRPASALRAVCAGMLRLLALVLTVLFVLSVAVGLLDLVVWQWLAGASWFPTSWLRPALAVAVLLCWAMLGALSRLGTVPVPPGERLRRAVRPARRTGEAVEDPFGEPGGLDAAEPPGFAEPDFFAGDPDAPILRRLHLSAGLLAISFLGSWTAVELGGGTLERVASVAAAVLLAATAVMTVFLGDAPGGRTRRSAWGRVASALSRGITGLAVGIVVLVAVLLVVPGRAPAQGGALPGVDGVVGVVTTVGLSALVLAVVFVGLLARATPEPADQPDRFRRFAHGLAPALIAGLGLFLGAGYTGAFTYAAQEGLSVIAGRDLAVTPLLQQVAFAWGVIFPLMVVLALALYLRSRWCARRHVPIVDRTFVGPDGHRLLTPGEVRSVARARTAARLKNHLTLFLVTVAVLGGLLGAAMLAAQVGGWDGPARLAAADAGPGRWLSVIGATTLVVLALGLFVVGLLSRAAPGLRRGVNVVWDVIAFWPRAVHPFVPAPYSQDVVPQLCERVGELLDEVGPDGKVVVAAHSQGSLVALAALRSVPMSAYPRLGVLTFGSQLRVIFPRAFPAYVTCDVVRWLPDTWERRWVSLFRDTDPIGGPVASWSRTEPPEELRSCRLGTVGLEQDWRDPLSLRRVCGNEWRLVDPPVDLSENPPRVGGMRKHSAYWLDGDWPIALDTALGGDPERSRDPAAAGVPVNPGP